MGKELLVRELTTGSKIASMIAMWIAGFDSLFVYRYHCLGMGMELN